MRHRVELAATTVLTLSSMWFACVGNFPAATYLLMMALAIDFDDWTRRGRQA